MYTPAFRISRFRPLFLGLAASACGALCLASSACGGGAGKGEPPSVTPGGSNGTAGTAAAAGTNPGGASPGGSSGGVPNPSAGVSAGGAAGGGIATAGSGGASPGGSGGGVSFGGATPVEGTATRPQLGATTAADFTVLKYLEKYGTVGAPVTDNWDPTAGVGDVAALTPKFTVAASGGTDTTVQSAITKAVAMGGTDRIAIEIAAGTYREVVCVPSGAPPITLYSKNADASMTRIVFNNYAGKIKDAATPANPCNTVADGVAFGTSGSATFGAYGSGFQAKNLTFENDTDETGLTGSVQGVALTAQGDKQIYENVRFLGNQDTFFFKSPATDQITRVYVTKSFIQGDTDFIFGRGVLVIDASEIHFVSSRQGSKGYNVAPSTDARNPHGILINKTQFTADAATTAGSIHLGRAWDESGKDLATYATLAASGIYPNGQALIRECTLGAHIRAADPWAVAATTARPFSSVAGTYPANRLYEYLNTGDGAAK
jgi:pectinesterase